MATLFHAIDAGGSHTDSSGTRRSGQFQSKYDPLPEDWISFFWYRKLKGHVEDPSAEILVSGSALDKRRA